MRLIYLEFYTNFKPEKHETSKFFLAFYGKNIKVLLSLLKVNQVRRNDVGLHNSCRELERGGASRGTRLAEHRQPSSGTGKVEGHAGPTQESELAGGD